MWTPALAAQPDDGPQSTMHALGEMGRDNRPAPPPPHQTWGRRRTTGAGSVPSHFALTPHHWVVGGGCRLSAEMATTSLHARIPQCVRQASRTLPTEPVPILVSRTGSRSLPITHGGHLTLHPYMVLCCNSVSARLLTYPPDPFSLLYKVRPPPPPSSRVSVP
jgi:hypothetical protein